MSDDNGTPPPEQPGPQFNPQSGYPAGQQPPYPPQPQPAYGQPGYPPGYPPTYGGYALPEHPKATTALIVGLVAVLGAFTCLVPILASPFAWVIGAQARREIREAPQQWSGESRATTGMVLGIVGTCLLALGILAVIVIVVIIAAADPSSIDYDTGV